MPTAELEQIEIEVPDWVDETWPDHTYKMTVFASGDCSEEEIEITRHEYITLKTHLAAMRGYRAPSFADAWREMKGHDRLDAYYDEDDQQVAMHIQTARDIYRAMPHVVLVESEAFDAEVNKLADE